MNPLKNFLTALIYLFITSHILLSCEEKEHKKKSKKEKMKNKEATANVVDSLDTDSLSCNPNLWSSVYDPGRLQVLAKCMTVTGVIEKSNAEDDGDQHMLVKLDQQYENLINKKNKKKKNGDLVIEAICINKITNTKVGDACKGYVNHVQLPNVGDRVKVMGSYVLDSHNGWTEIHPITRIERIK